MARIEESNSLTEPPLFLVFGCNPAEVEDRREYSHHYRLIDFDIGDLFLDDGNALEEGVLDVEKGVDDL